MKYTIEISPTFQKEAKHLLKKFRSLHKELEEFRNSLLENPFQGTPLGKNCFKIRLAIASKGKGKSGGAKIITYVFVEKGIIYLLTIFDKSEKENITSQELSDLLNSITF